MLPTRNPEEPFFFGGKEILGRFDFAMRDRGSEDWALFFAGARGCGKTALLEPLVDELSDLEFKYLQTMRVCLDDERLAATGDIARWLGKEGHELSRARARLIDSGTIAVPARGKVMFCIPYLADYAQRPESGNSVIEVARQRRV